MENNKNIEVLLEKFYEGETSLEEENYLRKYFSDNKNAGSPEASMFAFYNMESKRELKDNFDFKLSAAIDKEKRKKSALKKATYYFSSVAAIALIGLCSLYYYNSFNTGLDINDANLAQNKEVAERETQKALAALGTALNQADESLENLEYFDDSINQVENLEIFKIFENNN